MLMLRLPWSSSVCLVCTECIVAKRRAYSLQEVVHEKSIGSKMNDLDLCLDRIKVSLCQTLRYIRR